MDTSLNIALVGNPNTGKSTIFNGLTGLKQKTGNYPGITVEKKTGYCTIGGVKHRIIDLPGTYSLTSQKIDERLTYETLTGIYEHEERPDLVLVIVDSSNLERNLFLATQVMDLSLPMMLVLNMDDAAEEKGINIRHQELEHRLGIPIVSVTATEKAGIQKIQQAIENQRFKTPKPLSWQPGNALRLALDTIIKEWIKPYTKLPEEAHILEGLRLISDGVPSHASSKAHKVTLQEKIEKAQNVIERYGGNPIALEVMRRYDFINTCTGDSVTKEEKDEENWTNRIDAFVTHSLFGPVIFLLILLFIFQSIFTWATPFMDMIDLVFIETGAWLSENLPAGMLTDLLVEGVIAGLGGVVIFLPQILFLFFYIYLLEASGYMARAAFIMDGFMSRIGLHGRSVVPLISGFACAIPGIMATRSIKNWRDRIITIMVLPFMACSARLPVYALLIAAFIPATPVLGFIDLQGLTFFGLYFFGILMAVLSALVMHRIFPKGRPDPFIMELPDYRMPKMSVVLHNVFDRGKIFVTEAGKIIVGISIVLWFLASFPQVDVTGEQAVSENQVNQGVSAESSFLPSDNPEAYQLKQSYAGQFGSFIEPAIEPLGFDWKIGIGLLTSFAAREVMVGTLNTIYSIEGEGDQVQTLKQKLVNDRDAETGVPVYSTATALSLMVFFALAMQCMSTIAIVKRETNSWKWPVVMFSYMSVLAYLCSFIVYQTMSML
ncbi:ferrous iron transport protein B [Gracilimonas mengyeensis]|uniref:Ferrous iron transport protein B n=1 Tax=Gracilimonas mengyeensis TaxID=1302730 RepID=A0A521E1Y2_9BACT|nr:ferrous iron transport protein B [Gracilimonas mengyeensis]SMO77973.1 ferrous iron transport protein B [Gracilimonas mengyeensis]